MTQHFADLSSSIVITEHFQPVLSFFGGNIKLLQRYKIPSNNAADCRQKLVSIMVTTTFQEL